MMYSPSQLDAAGDVDPVAEADVYLAYGRDAQAEEILKEAARLHPERVAVHTKLLEIYAKRGDKAAMEAVASEIYALTNGAGEDWAHACRVAHPVDPDNTLYQLQGASRLSAATVSMPLTDEDPPPPALATDAPAPSSAAGLDLDLDFSLDDPQEPAPSAPTAAPAGIEAPMSSMDDLNATESLTSNAAEKDGPPSSMSMDFDLDFPSGSAPLQDNAPEPQPASERPLAQDAMDSLPFDDEPIISLETPAANSEIPANPPAPVPDMMSFDLNGINLDLDPPATGEDGDSESRLTEENPLETKLSLAEEFRAIGDFEGARSLAEEVLAEASGSLKTKAGTFLADLA